MLSPLSMRAVCCHPFLSDSSMLVPTPSSQLYAVAPLVTALCCRTSQWKLNAIFLFRDSYLLSLPPPWELYAVAHSSERAICGRPSSVTALCYRPLSDSSMLSPLWMTTQCYHPFSWQLYAVAHLDDNSMLSSFPMTALCCLPYLKDSSMMSPSFMTALCYRLLLWQLDAVVVICNNSMLTSGSMAAPFFSRLCDSPMTSKFLNIAQLHHCPWASCCIHNLAWNSLHYFPESFMINYEN